MSTSPNLRTNFIITKMRRSSIYVRWVMLFEVCAYESVDSTDLFTGCPVGLQLIGGSQEEEAVIAMTEIVDGAVKAYNA